MRLNSLSSAPGSVKQKRRVGRGIGSTVGKTCGRGHKGQHARSGGFHKVGFEGGQMPLQRRVPKYGFSSRKALRTAEVTLSEIEKMPQDVIDMQALYAANMITGRIKRVKIIASGTLTRAVKVESAIKLTKGALAAVKAAGGSAS